MAGKIFYMMIFWGTACFYVFGYLLKKDRNEKLKLEDKMMNVLFYFLLGRKSNAAVIENRAFLYATIKTGKLYMKTIFKHQNSIELNSGQISKIDNEKNKIFICFHQIGAEAAVYKIAKEKKYDEVILVGSVKGSFENQFSIYGFKLQHPENEFEEIINFGGVRFRLISLAEHENSYLRLVELIKSGKSVVMMYDAIYPIEIKKYIDSNGYPVDSRKIKVVQHRGRDIIFIPTYLIYLLKQTSALGIPVFGRRSRSGNTKIEIGEALEYDKQKSIDLNSEEIFHGLYEFMFENIKKNIWSWEHACNAAKIAVNFWKKRGVSEAAEKIGVCGRVNFNSYFDMDKISNEDYLLNIYYPFSIIKINKKYFQILCKIKRDGEVTGKLEKKFGSDIVQKLICNMEKIGFITILKNV